MLWNYIKNHMLSHPNRKMIEGDTKLTYQEIIERAESLAAGLDAPCYAVLCRSSLIEAVAILACFAAGKTAVPLSHRYGRIHCKRIIDAILPGFIISDDKCEAPHSAPSVSPLDKKDYTEPEQRPALIMCTSGTTGAPKGAMISEENLLCNLEDIKRYFKIGESDRIMIIRPLYHCAVLTGEFLISLIRGLDIHFHEKDFSPIDIIGYAAEKRITVMCGTPTLFSMLARFNAKAARKFNPRSIALSGECMTTNAAKTIRAGFKDAAIYNVYGLTEASPRAAYLPPEYFDARPESVGFPLYSMSARITDDDDRELPRGTVGELQIRGENIMRGYYNNAAATERAVSGRWLRTGDLALIDADGFIYIKGRKDNLIIRAGINIYPQEIENALRSDPRVREALVYGIPDEYCTQKIVLKISGDFKSADEVSELCIARLPEYELPQIIKLVDEIPKNASGKIIRGGYCGDE